MVGRVMPNPLDILRKSSDDPDEKRKEKLAREMSHQPSNAVDILTPIERGLRRWIPDIVALPGDIADAAIYAGRRAVTGNRNTPSAGLGAASRQWAREKIERTQPRSETEMSAIGGYDNPQQTALEEMVAMANPATWNPKLLAKPEVLSGLAAAFGGTPGMLGMIAGEGAKTANLEKLMEAKRRLNVGHDPSIVWFETGWGKSPEGRWIFDTPNVGIKYTPGKAAQQRIDSANHQADEAAHAMMLRRMMDDYGIGIAEAKKRFATEFGREPISTSGLLAKTTDYETLQSLANRASAAVPNRDFISGLRNIDIYQDPELFKAYPQLQDMRVDIDYPKIGSRYAGQYSPATKSETLNPLYAYGLESGKDVHRHELSHAIADIEGFQQGTNAEHEAMLLNKDYGPYPDELKPSIEAYRDFWRSLPKGERSKSPVGLFNRSIDIDDWYDSVEHLTPELKTKAETLLDDIDLARQNLYGMDEGLINKMRAEENYNNNFGEAMARMDSYRGNLTPLEQRQNYPFDPEYFKKATGTDLSKIIIRPTIPESNVSGHLRQYGLASGGVVRKLAEGGWQGSVPSEYDYGISKAPIPTVSSPGNAGTTGGPVRASWNILGD